MNSDAMYSMEKLGISKEELNLIKRQLRKPHTASWNRCDGNSYKVRTQGRVFEFSDSNNEIKVYEKHYMRN